MTLKIPGSEIPLTATKIIEWNREYWQEGGQGWIISQRMNKALSRMTDELFFRVQDIIAGRVREGWPTRDAAAFGEDE